MGFSLLYFSSVSFTLIVFSGKSSNSLKVQFGHVCPSWHILPSLCVRGVWNGHRVGPGKSVSSVGWSVFVWL